MGASKVDTALIQNTELFSSLSQNEIDFVVSRSGAISLAKGAPLFSSGEEAKHFYLLIKGAIRVYKSKDDNSEEELAVFATGDTIGDFDFARGANYDAHAEAAEDSELIVFPDMNLTMEDLSAENSRAICSILLNAIILITGRIKSTRKLIMENMNWVQELHRQAYEDSGTGLWKHTLISDEIVNMIKEPTALIMLKPDRFKILVDSRGHAAGDEAMVKIALILKNITRITGNGWPIRLKSNEVAIILNNCNHAQTREIAASLQKLVADIEPVPAKDDIPEFKFTATISWSVWPNDDHEWESFFSGNYANLLSSWKNAGDTIVQYTKTGNP
ncbi:MAG: diguanylate cyclase [Treponema sp.]|jgi:diguanylate cyclase (GGDEF)-like protein|nr:diguanylate cyclase [Treponema sp.]